MAHFAKIGIDNLVLETVRVSNRDCINDEGEFLESLGIAYLQNFTGHETWIRCSYNTRGGVNSTDEPPLRKNFPSIGWTYDSDLDAFVEPAIEGVSWEINAETGLREPPVAYPDDDLRYRWDEPTLSWVEMPQSEWYV